MDEKQHGQRRAFTPEYKAEVVALCRRGEKSIGTIARDLDISESVVRRWVAQAEIDSGQREGLTTAESRRSLFAHASPSWKGRLRL